MTVFTLALVGSALFGALFGLLIGWFIGSEGVQRAYAQADGREMVDILILGRMREGERMPPALARTCRALEYSLRSVLGAKNYLTFAWKSTLGGELEVTIRYKERKP